MERVSKFWYSEDHHSNVLHNIYKVRKCQGIWLCLARGDVGWVFFGLLRRLPSQDDAMPPPEKEEEVTWHGIQGNCQGSEVNLINAGNLARDPRDAH